MRKSVKLALRASEIRTEHNKLEPTEENAEKRRQLMAELETVETEYRAALEAEEAEIEANEQRRAAGELTAEERQVRELGSRCNLAAIVEAVMEHRAIEGAERELQQHYGLGGNQIPLDLLETRAVTPAPAEVGQNQAMILPGVFPMACAAFLGVPMPRVAVGDAVYPVLTQNAEVRGPHTDSTDATETTGAFSADVLAPARIQASFFYRRTDRARFLGMDMALRENLSMALADGLDKEVIAGTNGLLTGTNLPNNNVNAVTTFALYLSGLGYGQVDGTYAGDTRDLKIVMGAATYAHAGSVYRSVESDMNALDRLGEITGGVKVSAHVPAVASNKQNAVIRRGMARAMVAPVWEGVTMIPDELTKAGTGEIVLTAVLLHAVKIVRPGTAAAPADFVKQQLQHA